jgi:hypothetical protein
MVTLWISPSMETSTKVHAAHRGAGQVDALEPRTGRVDGPKPRAAHPHALELVLTHERTVDQVWSVEVADVQHGAVLERAVQ